MGVTDVVVHLLSAARDVAGRTPYQLAIVPKLLELADEILRFGDTKLQEEFIEHVEATRQGLEASTDFLFALKAPLPPALPPFTLALATRLTLALATRLTLALATHPLPSPLRLTPCPRPCDSPLNRRSSRPSSPR